MPEALKDTLYSRQSFDEAASVLQSLHPAFERTKFLNCLFDDTRVM